MPINTPNQRTIDTYNKEVKAYIEHTPRAYEPHHQHMLAWINCALSLLPQSAKILEIGSATPRDATYMHSKGFTVQCSDATPAFVDYLRQNGEDALLLDILRDNLPSGYDMVFANSVSPHFTRENMELVLKKVYDYLPAGGVFALNVKQGVGEEWIKEKMELTRYTLYWQPDAICKLIEQFGFKIVFCESNVAGDLVNHHWINIVVQKPV